MIRQLHCQTFFFFFGGVGGWGGGWGGGSPCEVEPWEGKHKQGDPTSLCLEHLCPKHFGLGLEIRTVEVCGSDEW